MANSKQSGSRMLDAWSVKFTFSLKVIFYLTKTEDTALTLLLWVKVVFLTKMLFFCIKKCSYQQKGAMGAMGLNGIFSEPTYVCALKYQMSSF